MRRYGELHHGQLFLDCTGLCADMIFGQDRYRISVGHRSFSICCSLVPEHFTGAGLLKQCVQTVKIDGEGILNSESEKNRKIETNGGTGLSREYAVMSNPSGTINTRELEWQSVERW